MDIKFSKDSGDTRQEAPDEKKNQSALVLLLLILIGGFTYVYFFTGLIKPQEAQKTAEAPAAAPQIVKLPLPPRDGEVVKTKGTAAVTAETPKAAVPAAAAPTNPAAKPAVAPAASAKPAAVPAVAPAAKASPPPPAPKPKEEIKTSAVVKPGEKKPLPTAAADKKVAAAAKAETKKQAEADTKAAPAKETVKKPAADGTTKARMEGRTKPAAAGPWSIVVGSYVLEEALSADMGRIRKSGLQPVVKPGSRKKAVMNRLFVSDFTDRASAQQTLEKLLRHTSDAFVIDQGGSFALYAGSYLQSEAAHSEKERLKAAGFATALRRAEIAIPSQNLSVGPFTSKKAADAARGKLANAGIKATLSQP